MAFRRSRGSCVACFPTAHNSSVHKHQKHYPSHRTRDPAGRIIPCRSRRESKTIGNVSHDIFGHPQRYSAAWLIKPWGSNLPTPKDLGDVQCGFVPMHASGHFGASRDWLLCSLGRKEPGQPFISLGGKRKHTPFS
jgi:hypothetical protein